MVKLLTIPAKPHGSHTTAEVPANYTGHTQCRKSPQTRHGSQHKMSMTKVPANLTRVIQPDTMTKVHANNTGLPSKEKLSQHGSRFQHGDIHNHRSTPKYDVSPFSEDKFPFVPGFRHQNVRNRPVRQTRHLLPCFLLYSDVINGVDKCN